MKISFNDITGEGIRTSVTGDRWWLNNEVTVAEQPACEVTLTRVDEVTVKATGHLETVFESNCSRCNEITVQETTTDFTYVFRLGADDTLSEMDRECRPEDTQTVYLKEPVIDLYEMASEQLILSQPEKLLCSESCKGLCMQCGVSLNEQKCQCGDEVKDSPFAVLKQLKK